MIACQKQFVGANLNQMVSLQLQHRQGEPVQLTAAFTCPIALCMWRSFTVGSTVIDVEIPVFWLAAAESVATQASWLTLKLLDAQAVKGLADLAPTSCVPDGFAVTTSDILSPEWLSVSTAARPILLLVRNVLLMSTWHEPGLLPESPDVDACKRTGAEVMRANMDKMRSHLAFACAANSTTSASSEISDHLLSLRTTLLLLKVAELLSFLKLKDLALENALHAVWAAVAASSDQASEDVMLPVQHADAAGEEHIMSLFLVQMARPLMKQMLKGRSVLDTLHLSWACHLHRDLLPSSIPSLLQAVASDIISGVMCL